MGRDRPLQGVPYHAPRKCFEQIERLDKEVSAAITDVHAKEQEKHNRSIRSRPKFQVGPCGV